MEKKKAGPLATTRQSVRRVHDVAASRESYEAAEPAYLNAQDLIPGDARWPYYLGHLYKSIGQTGEVDSIV